MAGYFIDSSALVKRYRREDGSQRVANLMNAADRLVASRLTQIEVSSALVRRGRGVIAPGTLAMALASLDRAFLKTFETVEINDLILGRAIALTRRHGLRAADAVQLASAISAASSQPLTLLACDIELNAAAVAEGIQVLDPTHD